MTEKLISADSHVDLTEDWVRDRLPQKSKAAYEEAVKTFHNHQNELRGVTAEERLTLADFGDLAPGATDPGYSEPNARLAAMDRDGVHAEILYSELSAFRQFHHAGDHWKEVARAFNDALTDFAAVNPDRLVVSYQLPIIDIDHAVDEIHRLAALGARSVQLPNYPAELGFPDYHEKAYDPLWSAISETEITISQHLGFKESNFDVYRRDPTPYKSIHSSMTGLMLMENVSFWLVTGVLDRFPKLRIVFVEPPLHLVTMWVKQIDNGWRRAGGRMYPEKRSPLETFHEQMFLTFIGGNGIDERYEVGVENLMWSTDFPHPASSWPNSVKIVDTAFADVPADERKLIVSGNAARVYGLAA